MKWLIHHHRHHHYHHRSICLINESSLWKLQEQKCFQWIWNKDSAVFSRIRSGVFFARCDLAQTKYTDPVFPSMKSRLKFILEFSWQGIPLMSISTSPALGSRQFSPWVWQNWVFLKGNFCTTSRLVKKSRLSGIDSFGTCSRMSPKTCGSKLRRSAHSCIQAWLSNIVCLQAESISSTGLFTSEKHMMIYVRGRRRIKSNEVLSSVGQSCFFVRKRALKKIRASWQYSGSTLTLNEFSEAAQESFQDFLGWSSEDYEKTDMIIRRYIWKNMQRTCFGLVKRFRENMGKILDELQ